MTAWVRKYLSELSLSVATLALGGFVHFAVEWGALTKEVEAHISNTSVHGWGETDELVQKRLDSMEQRLENLLQMQSETLRLLGRLEGKNERDQADRQRNLGPHRPE